MDPPSDPITFASIQWPCPAIKADACYPITPDDIAAPPPGQCWHLHPNPSLILQIIPPDPSKLICPSAALSSPSSRPQPWQVSSLFACFVLIFDVLYLALNLEVCIHGLNCWFCSSLCFVISCTSCAIVWVWRQSWTLSGDSAPSSTPSSAFAQPWWWEG